VVRVDPILVALARYCGETKCPFCGSGERMRMIIDNAMAVAYLCGFSATFRLGITDADVEQIYEWKREWWKRIGVAKD